jgi:hypothetical protein
MHVALMASYGALRVVSGGVCRASRSNAQSKDHFNIQTQIHNSKHTQVSFEFVLETKIKSQTSPINILNSMFAVRRS